MYFKGLLYLKMLVSNYKITFSLKNTISKIIIDGIEIKFDIYYYSLNEFLTIDIMLSVPSSNDIKVSTYYYDKQDDVHYADYNFEIKTNKYFLNNNLTFTENDAI